VVLCKGIAIVCNELFSGLAALSGEIYMMEKQPNAKQQRG
jgi:hypothetical protein